MSKQLTRLELKKANQAARDAALAKALVAHKKERRALDTGARKRKDVAVLLDYLSVAGFRSKRIRVAADYTPKSYNLSRQIVGLVDHLFAKYSVPLFLYRSILTPAGRQLVLQVDDQRLHTAAWEQNLYFVVAQGGSVAQALKGKLTKKESHWFLQAPECNTVRQNLLWAKCRAAGIPPSGCQFLVERLWPGGVAEKLGERLPDVLRLYAGGFEQMNDYTRGEVTDFIRAVCENPSFCFKGRTLGSIVKLSNEWHLTGIGGSVSRYQSWAPMFGLWEKRMKLGIVRAVELTNNRALAEEGKRQRHCVFTYTYSCLDGWARIVSLRWVERGLEGDFIAKRLTVEVAVRTRKVVQVRGRMNRMPEPDELKILREWAGTMGLTLDLE